MKYIFFAIVLHLCSLHSFSQSRPDSVSYLKSYFTNTQAIIAAPFHWDKQDIANVVMVTGTTAFLMVYDEKMDDFLLRNNSSKLKKISSNFISPFGNGVYTLPLLGTVYLAGVLTKNPYDKEMALLGLKTFIISAGEATVIKMALGRNRPADQFHSPAFQFDGPFKKFSDNGAFVSRHATTSFAVATIMAEGYKSEKRWVPWMAYSLASLVTVSRVYEREHWVSDAFAGACLGYVTGRFMYRINQKKFYRKTFQP